MSFLSFNRNDILSLMLLFGLGCLSYTLTMLALQTKHEQEVMLLAGLSALLAGIILKVPYKKYLTQKRRGPLYLLVLLGVVIAHIILSIIMFIGGLDLEDFLFFMLMAIYVSMTIGGIPNLILGSLYTEFLLWFNRSKESTQ